MKARKLTQMAMLTAIALTIFMIEAQIPALVPIPGIKLGLANIVTVFAVFAMGPKEAASILFVRIFLGAVFAGNFSTILYSGAGGLCAILVSIGLGEILTKKQLWVAGALSAIGQGSFSLPPLEKNMWLLVAAFVVLLLPLIPFKQLLPAACVHKQTIREEAQA